jgi:hypothetical protein
MNNNSSKPDRNRDLDDVIENEPQSKHGRQGNAAHSGEQAGPNSDEGGQTIAPQMGDRESTDVEVGTGG